MKKEECFAVSFFSNIEYQTAERTASVRNAIPAGNAFRLKSLLMSINRIPPKEIISPIILSFGNFSDKEKYATIGIISGIVEIKTALIVGEENFIPKLSPIK